MKIILIISLVSLFLIGATKAQSTGTALSGNVIGTYYLSSQAQCSYWCQNQYVSVCVAWSINTATGICQFFSSVSSTSYTGSSSQISGYVTSSTTSSVCTATLSNPNLAITGNVIATFGSSTQTQCSYYCQTQYNGYACVAWTFNSVTGVCQFLSSVTGYTSSSTQKSGCISSAGTTLASTTVATTTTVAAVAVASGTICSAAASNPNVAITGNVIGTYSASEAQCSYWCQQQYVSGCVAWTYNTATSTCQFLGTITGSSSSSTQQSGCVSSTSSAASVCSSVQTSSNQAITGNVIGTYGSATQAQCSYWCQNQYVSGCVAWTFNSATGVCQFFNSITGSTTSSTQQSGCVSSSSACTVALTNPNIAVTGNVIATFGSSTQAQCSYYCQTQYNGYACTAWTFNSATGVCQFLSSVTGYTSSTTQQSGCITAVTTAASTATSTLGTTTTATTTTTTTPATTTPTSFCLLVAAGTNYPGNDIVEVGAVSPSDCCNKCGQNPSCGGFAFQNPNSCYLKTTIPGTAPANANADPTISMYQITSRGG